MATRRTVSAKDGATAIAMLDAEKKVAAEPAADGTDQRRCIGSAKFGIEAHEAPAADFPIQPSQKDGLGRMCKPHWNEYTNALRKAALARKAADAVDAAVAPTASEADAKPEPNRTRAPRRKGAHVPAAGSQGDAG
jgi:hypothetical protein